MLQTIEKLAVSLMLMVAMILIGFGLSDGYPEGVAAGVLLVAYCLLRYAIEPDRFA